MANLLEDSNGDFSHKRVINIAATVCAVVLTIGLPTLAILRNQLDIGAQMVALILGIWAIAAGGAVASNIVEKLK